MKNLILIILVPNLLLAQKNLSLLDAIKIGLKDNYDIQISNKNYKINQVNNNWGNAGALPKVTSSLLKKKKNHYLIRKTILPHSFNKNLSDSDSFNDIVF